MKTWNRLLRLELFLAAASGWAALSASNAAEATAGNGAEALPRDKSRHHLFNPTPAALMREMSTDRPDKTESAYTVDAGHFQIESDLVSYSYDHDVEDGANTRVDAWTVAAINFKMGLLNNVDLQTVVEAYNHITTDDLAVGQKTRQSGFGDITSRLKINLWGNDGGTTALAVMPYVKFPTSQDDIGNNSIEGGLIVPMAVELPHGFGLGLMTQVDFVRDVDDSDLHTEFVNTITVGRDLVGNLGGYIEFYTAVSTEDDADWVGTIDVGLTYGWTENLQLDAGINIGVTRSADDFNPFVGISYRF
jgi:hypothetical protein